MILIVAHKKSYARELTNILDILGVISYPTTLAEAYREVSLLYRAVVVIDPDFLCDTKSFVDTIHSYVKSMPIYALYSKEIGKDAGYFTDYFMDNIMSKTFINRMAGYAKANGIPCPGDYRLAGINANADLPNVLYFDRNVNLTKTEAKILRFLIRSYPKPRKCETIIKYLYKPAKAPEPSSIRTHICKINSKFENIFGEAIIRSPEGTGYVIYTPELKKRAEEAANKL